MLEDKSTEFEIGHLCRGTSTAETTEKTCGNSSQVLSGFGVIRDNIEARLVLGQMYMDGILWTKLVVHSAGSERVYILSSISCRTSVFFSFQLFLLLVVFCYFHFLVTYIPFQHLKFINRNYIGRRA